MASITVTATSVCSGGEHITMTITGAKSGTVRIDASNLSAPITDDDVEAFVKILCRLCKAGKTVAQTKSAMTAGITVTA